MRVLTSATLLLCFVLITTGCPQELVMPVEFSELQTDKTFNYETIRQVSIDLSFSDYPSILVDLYAAIEITEETYAHADPFEEFTPLGTILLSSDGTYSAGLSVPSAATVLVISPRFPGIPGTLEAPIVSNAVSFIYQEADADEREFSAARAVASDEGSYEENGFRYVSTFDTDGKPEDTEKSPLNPGEITDMLKRIQPHCPSTAMSLMPTLDSSTRHRSHWMRMHRYR